MEIDIYCTTCKKTVVMPIEEKPIFAPGRGEHPLWNLSSGPVLGVKSHCPICKTYQFRLVSLTNDFIIGTRENLGQKILKEHGCGGVVVGG